MLNILEHLKCCKTIIDENGHEFDNNAFEVVSRLPGQSKSEANIRTYQIGSIVVVRRFDYEQAAEVRVLFELDKFDNKWSFDIYQFNPKMVCVIDYDIPYYRTEEEFFQMSLLSDIHNNTFEELEESEKIVHELRSIHQEYCDNAPLK